MKIKTAITIAILTLTSCQLLKKDKLTLKKLNQKEEFRVTEQRNIVDQQSRFVLIDSANQDYTTMLWPKGRFKFTVTNGFEGEAEKILIMGKSKSQKIHTLEQQTTWDSTLLKASYSNQKQSSINTKMNKASLRYNWAWLLVLPFIYLCYWLYKRF